MKSGKAQPLGPVIAFAVFLTWAVVGQSTVAVGGLAPERAGVMVGLLAAGLLVELAILRAIYLGRRPSWWLLAGITVVTVAQIVTGGVTLADDPVLLASAVLFILRPPWSYLVFGLVVAASAPFGEVGRWWIAPGIVFLTSGSLYLLGWALRLVRQLRLARRDVAELAAVRERHTVMRELDAGVGAGLAEIARRLDSASAKAADLDEVTRLARETADEARRIAHGFRHSSLTLGKPPAADV